MKYTPVIRHQNHSLKSTMDKIADESPLAIDLVYGPSHNRSRYRLATTMRTPGHDCELALGLLFSLGIIKTMSDIADATVCARLNAESPRTVTIHLGHHTPFSPHQVSFGHVRYAACGVCASIDVPKSTKLTPSTFTMSTRALLSLPEKMRARQQLFNQTGGVHAAALFDGRARLCALFEDVGRHNALDKLIGFMVNNQSLPLAQFVLLMSSRASYEIIQKASVAQIPMIAVMGAVSSLAVTEALASDICLIGFLRADRFNVYTHEQRVTNGEVTDD